MLDKIGLLRLPFAGIACISSVLVSVHCKQVEPFLKKSVKESRNKNVLIGNQN
jgi:hypothetical protein